MYTFQHSYFTLKILPPSKTESLVRTKLDSLPFPHNDFGLRYWLYLDAKTDFNSEVKSLSLKDNQGTEITDANTILSVLGRAGNIAGQSEDKGLVEAYQSDALALSKQPFPQLTESLNKLDDLLYLCSFLVGYAPTVADFAIWGAIKCE